MESRYTIVCDENIKKEFQSYFNNPNVPLFLKQRNVIEGYMRFFVRRMKQLESAGNVKLDFLFNQEGEPYKNELRTESNEGLFG